MVPLLSAVRGLDAESIKLIHHALDSGVNLLDTADVHAPHTNEVLVGKAIEGRRDAVFLDATCRNDVADMIRG